MSLVVERKPRSIFVTDSCENDIDGFSLKTGRARTFEFSAYLKGRDNGNALECLVEFFLIWVGIVKKEVNPLDCAFSCTNNTLSIG